MHVLYNKQNMDELSAEAVGLGRQVADRAMALQLGENAREVGFVSRCFANLKERQPFDKADEGGFDAVLDILERCIATECLGTTARFEETGYDEFGPHGETCEIPLYTNRGNELIKLKYLFQKFINIRNGVLDHVAAHRGLLEIMND